MTKAGAYFFLLLLFVAGGCKNVENPQVQKITAEQLLDAIEVENIQLIDVRTKAEYDESRIKKAQNICITNDDFKAKAEKLDKNRPVYLYCRSGVRSAKAAEVLREMGFKIIYEMSGGMQEWDEKGYETDKS